MGGGWHRCDGCDTRTQLDQMTKCKICPSPYSAGLLCRSCDMCAGCVPSNNDRHFNQGPSFRAPQAPHPHAGQTKAEQAQRPGWNSRPLHEDLGECWLRSDAQGSSTAPSQRRSRAVPSRPSQAAPVKVAAAESSRRAPVRVVASDMVYRDASGRQLQRHERTPTPDLDADLDALDILLAMGFGEGQARTALQRCSSVEASVEYIM